MNGINPRQPIHILFVLNDKAVEGQIRKSLLPQSTKLPHHASYVNSGHAALESLQSNIRFDIVFTELNLPVMNGLSLLRHLDAQYPRIKTVLLSQKDDYNTIRAALNRGAFDFLLLPLDPLDFEQTLNNVLKEARIFSESLFNQEKLLAIEHDLDIARQIQTTVISNHEPDVNLDKRITIGGHSKPAHQVGGDFYDNFFLDKDRIGFVIGDVASKGLPAALFMATSRTLVRSLAFQGYSPDKCLKEVNKILFRESDPSLFIAVFYGVIDMRTGEISYSNGGHTFPYHVNEKGDIRLMNEPGGMVLGVLEESEYRLQRLKMSRGDVLFLYTDGFLSIANDSNDIDLEILIKNNIIKMESGTLTDNVLRIFEDIKAVTAIKSFQDDLTCFALGYRGEKSDTIQ